MTLTTRADLVCGFAELTFTAARATLRVDPDAERRAEAIRNAATACDGLAAVLALLIGPERSEGPTLSTPETHARGAQKGRSAVTPETSPANRGFSLSEPLADVPLAQPLDDGEGR